MHTNRSVLPKQHRIQYHACHKRRIQFFNQLPLPDLLASADSRGSRVGMFLKIYCPVLETQSGGGEATD